MNVRNVVIGLSLVVASGCGRWRDTAPLDPPTDLPELSPEIFEGWHIGIDVVDSRKTRGHSTEFRAAVRTALVERLEAAGAVVDRAAATTLRVNIDRLAAGRRKACSMMRAQLSGEGVDRPLHWKLKTCRRIGRRVPMEEASYQAFADTMARLLVSLESAVEPPMRHAHPDVLSAPPAIPALPAPPAFEIPEPCEPPINI